MSANFTTITVADELGTFQAGTHESAWNAFLMAAEVGLDGAVEADALDADDADEAWNLLEVLCGRGGLTRHVS